MNRLAPLIAALAMLGTASAPAAAAPPAMLADAPMPTLAPMIQRVSPAIVNIATRGTIEERAPENPLLDDPLFRRFFDVPPGSDSRERPFQSAGSGVIFDAQRGYILTNAHLVENASEITVTLDDGRSLQATLVGSDQPSDIAVLKIEPVGLTAVALANSSTVRVGDFVVAIGNPFGLHNTVTFGIVSGLGRSDIGTDAYEDFLQTDASINPGNSGGALVNLRGQLIGINTAILSRSSGNTGIGFAIPVNMARSIAAQIIRFGAVSRGVLGVSTYEVSPDIARVYGVESARGALVTQIVAGSPAQRAGIEVGDIITSVDGRPVDTPTDLRNAIGLLRVGERVELGLVRHGRLRHVRATIAAPPSVAAANLRPSQINQGLEGATLVDAPGRGGALVQGVEPGSPAAQAGLRSYDLIVGANQRSVASVRQLWDRAQGVSTLVLEIKRGNTIVLVPVR
jgi:Do/DeqQ family serine protease